METNTRYSHWTLTNGLRVLHAYRPWNRTFAAAIGFEVGWCDEDKRHRGLTHLVEHLAFSGSNLSLVESLSSDGVVLNGMTEWEQTLFLAGGHNDLFPQLLDFYQGVLQGVSPDKAALDNELAIIVREMAGGEESPVDMELRGITARILGDPGLGSPPPTTVRNLMRLTPDEIEQYARQRFSACNAVLTVVSPTDPETLHAQLDRTLGQAERGERIERAELEVDVKGGDALLTRYYHTPQVLAVLSFAYRPRSLHPLAAVAMLNELVGNGFHSFLHQAMRQQAQMSYHHGSNLAVIRNTVLFQVSALVRKRDARKALQEMLAFLKRVRTEGIDVETFEAAQRRMIHGLDALEDDSSNLCDWLAHEATISDEALPTPDLYRQQIRELTLDAFNAAARKILQPSQRTTTLLGGVRFPLRWRAKRLLKRDRVE